MGTQYQVLYSQDLIIFWIARLVMNHGCNVAEFRSVFSVHVADATFEIVSIQNVRDSFFSECRSTLNYQSIGNWAAANGGCVLL